MELHHKYDLLPIIVFLIKLHSHLTERYGGYAQSCGGHYEKRLYLETTTSFCERQTGTSDKLYLFASEKKK